MAAEKKSDEEIGPPIVSIGGIVIVNPDPPEPHARPPYRSKSDNFYREMSKDEFIKLWGPICLYDTSIQSLRSVKEILYPWWHDINDGKIIYNQNPKSTIYKTKSRLSNAEMVIKVYHVSKKKKEKHFALEVDFVITEYNFVVHTNLLQYHAICKDDKNDIYIAMEPLNKDLRQYVEERHGINGQGINELQCKCIVLDILNNLWIVHVAGYIHNDIKPENIMLRQRSNEPQFNGWKIIDFDTRFFMGLAKYKLLPSANGTIGWMPPEVNPLVKHHIFKKDNYLSYGYDIWALGLIILYILFGTHPYLIQGYFFENYWYKKKLLKNGKYDMDSDKNKGEIELRNYLMKLYINDQISKQLFDLLHNHMLLFDPRKRSDCKAIYNHPWFDDIRDD